jgi:hypothetical protein
MEFLLLESYKHVECKDVFFIVLAVNEEDKWGAHLRVEWCFHTPGNEVRRLNFIENLIIPPEQFKNWRTYDFTTRPQLSVVEP